MIKIGDKWVCIDNTKTSLKKYNIYTVSDSIRMTNTFHVDIFYLLEDDEGYCDYILEGNIKSKFMQLDEWREQQMKSVLND